MRCSSVLLLLGALLAVPVSVVFYIDAPEGWGDPWRLRLMLVPFKLFAITCDFLEPWVGEGVHVKVGRTLMELTYTLRGLPEVHQDVQVSNASLDGVLAIIYRPKEVAPTGAAALVYIHGGGWVFGSVVGFDRQSQTIARNAGIIVVSIEYRRAPEHQFPVPLQDCETAVTYFLKHAKDFGVDPNRIALSGDSAGGNLAVAVSLNLRQKGVTPRVALQVLVYPVLQAADFNTPSYHTHAHHAVVRKHIMATCWMLYMFGHVRHRAAFMANQHTSAPFKETLSSRLVRHADLPPDHFPPDYQPTPAGTGNATLWREVRELVTNPLLSPLLAEDLSDLPRTYMLTVEQDILRDEGFLFVRRLRDAGVPVMHRHYRNNFHGGLVFADRFEDSRIMLDETIAYIKDNL